MNTSEVEIWRTAHLMIEHYGEGAVWACLMRADDSAEKGSDQNYKVWTRILTAVRALSRRPQYGDAIH